MIQARNVQVLMQEQNIKDCSMERKYSNPNDAWYYNHRYDLSSTKSMKGCFYSLAGVIIIIVISLLLSSCESIQYIPVEKVKTEYINRTDTVNKIDTLISEKETIIREADSSLVARLGLQLKANERAILILQKELERQVSKESEHRTDTVIKTDSVQVPYPVEKKLTKWQQIKIDWGGSAMIMLAIFSLLIIVAIVDILRRR